MRSNVQPLNLQYWKSGGQAHLYLGQLEYNGPTVVFKVPKDHHILQRRQEFLQQIDILSSPRNGVIPILAFDKNANPPWYAMPFYRGGSLTQYARRLSAQQLLGVASYLAQTLSVFHATAGALGDLKPDNILLSGDGIPALADPLGNGSFGLIGALFFPQRRAGTAGYWAPEVKAGGPMSEQADMFSFAATLSHLVTGLVPKDGQSLDPADAGIACPRIIRELIIACSQEDPNVRANMQEVKRILNGSTWADILKSRQQRQEQVQGLVAVGVLVGLGALAVSALASSKG